jgi:glycosyltransferase involved in cell wall biosynthesis
MRVIARMNIGGPAVQITGLMRGINKETFDQRLYTGFCANDEADYLELIATDVNAIRIPGFGRRVSVSRDLRAFITLITEIRTFKPHIIHTHTAKAGFLTRIASILSLHQSILVHTYHGHLLHGYFGKIKRLLVVMAEKWLSHHTHESLAVGDKVRQDLLKAGVGKYEKFSLMPPGLEIGRLPSKRESQESFGLETDRFQVALIGRVTKIKRPDRFLDVVSELKNREIQIDFFVAGDGDLLEKCKNRVLSEELPVTFLGWQGNIEKVLSAADLVVLTSDNEGTPLSLIQAGMASLPVVATNVGSVPEIVIDGVTGIITTFDIEEIADAIENLMKNEDLSRKLGTAAEEFTNLNFGVKRLVSNHEILYKKLVSNKRTRFF